MINPNNKDKKNWKKSLIFRFMGMIVLVITGALTQALVEDTLKNASILFVGLLLGFYFTINLPDRIIYGKRLVKKRGVKK